MKVHRSFRASWLLVAILGCGHTHPRTPEQLRAAYARALATNDPDAAYALLAPEVQAKISREDFRTRWKGQPRERRAAAAAVQRLPEQQSLALREATTAHGNGATLRWVDIDGRYRVVSGLPGVPNRETPSQAIRAFLDAVRAADWSGIRALLSDELAARLQEDWLARAAAIERALDQPGNLYLSRDSRRAELRYDRGRSLLLEQSPTGWNIIAIE